MDEGRMHLSGGGVEGAGGGDAVARVQDHRRVQAAEALGLLRVPPRQHAVAARPGTVHHDRPARVLSVSLTTDCGAVGWPVIGRRREQHRRSGREARVRSPNNPRATHQCLWRSVTLTVSHSLTLTSALTQTPTLNITILGRAQGARLPSAWVCTRSACAVSGSNPA